MYLPTFWKLYAEWSWTRAYSMVGWTIPLVAFGKFLPNNTSRF